MSPSGTSLTVASVRAVLLSHRYAPGDELTWVGGTIHSWDAALVEVTLDDGSTGIGEAGAGIMAAVAVPGIVDAFRPYLLGREFGHPLEVADHLRAYTAFWSRGGILNGVAGAIETAVVDAVAKREGAPAYELLGGLKRPTIEAYASGGLGTTFEQVSAWAEQQVAAGFGTVKFRAMQDPDTTLRLLDHVVPNLPDGTRFILDAVQACASDPWSFEDAIRVGRHASTLGARWFEEPCQADDLTGFAAVRAAIDAPVSGVESNGTVREFAELIAAGSVDIAQPDVTFVGGPAAFARVADLAHDAGLQTVPHVWGSGVTFSANLHTVLANPWVELFEFCTLPNPLREALVVEPVVFEGGHVHAPTGPGLGVALTPELEAAFPFTPGVAMSSVDGFVPLPGDDRLSTAILSDSLDAAGLRHQVLQQRLAPIVPGSRAIGRATTCRFAPSLVDHPDDPYRAAIDYIDSVRAGQLVVIATDGNNDSAFWGELFSAAALGAGAAGVITDGNLRDTDKIAGLGFPAFSRSRRPIDYRARMEITGTDVAVTVHGVLITPGDLVMADDDGVVVVPAARETEVLSLARERAARESTVLDELLSGQSLRAVWDRHRVL